MKGKDCYDLNCIDNVTKYVTAHLFVEKRTLAKCKELLKQIKRTCYDQILERYQKEKAKPLKKRKLVTFVCDCFENYRTAFNSLFYRVAKLVSGVPIACKKYGLKHNNNAVERYNGSLKDRIKTMRGGFGSFQGAETFMNLKRVIYNFVNPHQELKGKTPAEAADVELQLGRNRLLDLIRYVRRTHIPKR
ncbi:MAG: DDE-type integrase/transposase/recombinase [Thaumarchaeota archaeon]|nr:DDE-type integrase/transposase/recombinase [Nitrososphaerota archaeon]